MEVFECSNCHDRWPSNHFREDQQRAEAVVRWCARCEAADDPKLDVNHKCEGCKKMKPLRAYAPVIIKHIVFRVGAQDGGTRPHGLKCQSCQYPKCKGLRGNVCKEPEAKRLYPALANMYHEGVYVCTACKYPPCACGAERPRDNKGGQYKAAHSALNAGQENWTCEDCKSRTKLTCTSCNETFPRTNEHWNVEALNKLGHLQKPRCLTCQYPTCQTPGCGKQHPRAEDPWDRCRKKGKICTFFCAACRETLECRVCGKMKEARHFDQEELRQKGKSKRRLRCNECQEPNVWFVA